MIELLLYDQSAQKEDTNLHSTCCTPLLSVSIGRCASWFPIILFWIFDQHLLSEMAWPENLESTCIFCLIYLGTSSVSAGLWESMKENFVMMMLGLIREVTYMI